MWRAGLLNGARHQCGWRRWPDSCTSPSLQIGVPVSVDPLKTLSDLVNDAHTQIQAAHQHINPVVEVRQSMRDVGIPADVLTLDCLRTQRRITLILHDQHPGVVLYQFVTREEEVGGEFKQIALAEMSSQTLFDWMQDYFA